MSLAESPLVVGIGSPHGDDQAGWRVIESLSTAGVFAGRLRKAAVPHDIIDWLADCGELHIADACPTIDSLERMDLLHDRFRQRLATRSGGSHQVDVGTVLELAEVLKILPKAVTLWAIPGRGFRPNGRLSDTCERHAQCCADLIRQEVGGA